MKSYDVIGWLVNGDFYCCDCSPTNDEAEGAHPIFADSETDSPNHCNSCNGLIEEVLTTDGWSKIVEAAQEFLTERAGDPEIQRQWHEAYRDYADGSGERTLMEIWGEALDDTAVRATRRNVLRPVKRIVDAVFHGDDGPCKEGDCGQSICQDWHKIKKAVEDL